MKVVGVYLAAGDSKRMGMNKLLLDMSGNPLGSLALQAAVESDIDQVLVITKKENGLSWIAPHLFTRKYRQKWTLIQLPKSNQGQAYSIKCGLNKAMALGADAILILLADQPNITANILNLLILAFKKEPSRLFFACKYKGVLGPPVLFTKNFFSRLMSLQGDRGARNLLNGEYKENGEGYDLHHEDYFLDVDTWDDYDYLRLKR